MGQLRTEPKKQKDALSDEQYNRYLSILKQVAQSLNDHHVFYDLDEGEKPAKERKAFLHVSEKEGLGIDVRKLRGENALVFVPGKNQGQGGGSRMSAKEARQRILTTLKGASEPLKKGDIIQKTGISPSTWNLRIRELVKSGNVARHGERRDTTYSFKK